MTATTAATTATTTTAATETATTAMTATTATTAMTATTATTATAATTATTATAATAANQNIKNQSDLAADKNSVLKIEVLRQKFLLSRGFRSIVSSTSSQVFLSKIVKDGILYLSYISA